MKIWIVRHNTQYDGSFHEGVFTTFKEALKFCKKKYPNGKLDKLNYWDIEETKFSENEWCSIDEEEVVGLPNTPK